MSAQLKPFPEISGERPNSTQIVLAAGLYTTLLRDCLFLSEHQAAAVHKAYGLPPSVQEILGYGSAPEMLTVRQLERWLTARLQHERLDRMTDAEFFDWQIFGKVYDERERRYVHERLEPQPPLITDPYEAIEQVLNEEYGTAAGLPGFYLDGDILRLKTFPAYSLIVPCRIDSLIRALQVYPRAGEVNFFWHSTPNASGGASARASLHVANQHMGERERVCVVATHTVEADALAWQSGECAVAVNGISPLRFVRDLRLALPELKACAVTPALSDAVARTLRENGLRVRLLEMEDEDHA